jgi:hypothetical protein
MLKQRKTWLYGGLLIPPIVILILHAYNGTFTRLISDDYCSIHFAGRLGFLRDIWFQYLNLQGRYSLFACDTLLLWIGPRGLGYVTAVVLFLWAAAIIGILFGIQPQAREAKFKLRDAAGFGLVIFVACLLLAPNLPQSLYWWNGLATHTLPLFVFTYYLAFYAWLQRQEPAPKMSISAAIVAFFISIVAGGFSETFTVAQIILLVCWQAWLYFRKELDFRRPGAAYLAAGLVGALVALVIALVSPGNAVRQTQYQTTTNILGIVQISLYHYFVFLKDIFTTPEKILGVMSVFLGFLWFGQQIRPERNPKKWEPVAIFIIVSIMLTYGCFTPAAFGMSDAPPLRAQIIPVFFLLFGAASAAYLWGNLRSDPAGNENTGLLAITVVLLLVSSGIYGKQLYDSSARYIKYAQAWDENEQKILEAVKAGQETVIIHSVRNWAGLNDPGNNPKFFVNYCMSKYYNINILADNTGMQPPEP